MSRGRREKVAERRFAKMVRDNGDDCVKLGGSGPFQRTGDPDRVVFAKNRLTIFFEFKRVGNVATKLQKHRHKKLRALGFSVYVVYSAKEAWEYYKKEKREAARIRSEAVSGEVDRVLSATSRRRSVSGSRVGKDIDHTVRIQNTKEARSGRRTFGRRKKKNHLQRMA